MTTRPTDSYDRGRISAFAALVTATIELGFPEELAQVMAGELRSEEAMRKMCAYLRQARPTNPADIADEMLAITQVRDAWVQKQVSEHANASMTRFYNCPDRFSDQG